MFVRKAIFFGIFTEEQHQRSNFPMVRILYDGHFQYKFVKSTSFVSASQLSCITRNREDYSLEIKLLDPAKIISVAICSRSNPARRKNLFACLFTFLRVFLHFSGANHKALILHVTLWCIFS